MLFILLYREFGNVFSLTGSKTLQETLIRFIVFLRRPRCPCTEYFLSLYMQWLKGSFCWRKHTFSRTKNSGSNQFLSYRAH